MRPLRSAFPVLLLLLLLVLSVQGLGAPLNQLTDAEKRGGWELLFDGKTAAQWRNYRRQGIAAGWVVKEGALVRSTRGAGDIVTTKQYKWFELSIEYKISKGGNSGIMFHVTEEEAQPWRTGPEIQIQDNVDGHDPQKAGWLYQLYSPTKPDWAKRFEAQVGYKSPDVDDSTRPVGQWNHVYLRVSPLQSEVVVNGVSYYYFKKGDEEWNQRVAKSKFAKMPRFGKASIGHICLQDHGNLVAFRNIKIRRLPETGLVPDVNDGALSLQSVPAFPKLKLSGWESVDDDGKVRKLRPMVLTNAADGSGRIFVATQRGVVHSFNAKDRETKVFLDIANKVQPWTDDDEEGLLGLAFHPRFKENGELFVYYSSRAEPRTSVVSRFRVSAPDGQHADATKEEVLMKIPQPFSNHNGGSLVFGNDGFLYIALGDGGGRNDPLHHAQNLKTWMGSILRIDVDRKQQGLGYAIPRDNPFIDRPQAKPEIYAYGFRNVWRLSVDRKTGLIWCGDVGQDLWEEVNILRSGGNYGWSIREGNYGFGNQRGVRPEQTVAPCWEYDHQIGKSITGGVVYRGSELPELAGHYLFGDYISGRIWALHYDAKAEKPIRNMVVLKRGTPAIAFGEDESGEVYYLVETVSGNGIQKFSRSQ